MRSGIAVMVVSLGAGSAAWAEGSGQTVVEAERLALTPRGSVALATSGDMTVLALAPRARLLGATLGLGASVGAWSWLTLHARAQHGFVPDGRDWTRAGGGAALGVDADVVALSADASVDRTEAGADLTVSGQLRAFLPWSVRADASVAHTLGDGHAAITTLAARLTWSLLEAVYLRAEVDVPLGSPIDVVLGVGSGVSWAPSARTLVDLSMAAFFYDTEVARAVAIGVQAGVWVDLL